MKRLASLTSESPLAWLEPTFERPSDRADLRRFMAGCGQTPSTTQRSSWTGPRRAEGDPFPSLEFRIVERPLLCSEQAFAS